MLAWVDAWHRALYGPHGFYRGSGPRAHFTTATHGALGSALAQALAQLARERGLEHVVDIGAGRGELVNHLYAADPGLRITGVDVVDRPDDLAGTAEWLVS